LTIIAQHFRSKQDERKEHRAWLRAERLKAYTELTKTIMTSGNRTEFSPGNFTGMRENSAQAVLLAGRTDTAKATLKYISLCNSLDDAYETSEMMGKAPEDMFTAQEIDEHSRSIRRRRDDLINLGDDLIPQLRDELIRTDRG